MCAAPTYLTNEKMYDFVWLWTCVAMGVIFIDLGTFSYSKVQEHLILIVVELIYATGMAELKYGNSLKFSKYVDWM